MESPCYWSAGEFITKEDPRHVVQGCPVNKDRQMIEQILRRSNSIMRIKEIIETARRRPKW